MSVTKGKNIMNADARVFDPDHPELSYTLPSECYYSPEMYKQDQKLIFECSWNFACHISQVERPGQYVKINISQEEVVVTRDKSGQLKGYYNVCLHRAHTIVQDDAGQANFFTCPYHAWTYNLDGTVRSARNCENVKGFCKDDFKLNEVAVEEFAGFVWVNLDTSAKPLRELAPTFERKLLEHCPDIRSLKFAHRETWDMNSNWKTAIENFSECYHCAPAHPGFVDLVAMPTYTVTTHDIWNVHVSEVQPNTNAPISVSTPQDRALEYVAFFFWPNVTMWIMPGAGNIGLLYMRPTGPETTREYFDFYFMSEVPTEEEKASIEYLRDVLQPEDIELCEKVQKGLRSRSYKTGRLFVDNGKTGISEHAVHHFQKLVHEAYRKSEEVMKVIS